MCVLLFPGIRQQEPHLDNAIISYRRRAYAANTQHTNRSQRDAYYRFCLYFGYNPVPADSRLLCRYVCFLARSLSPDSIACYINVIRIIHMECGHANPLTENWKLSTTLRGIKRAHGRPAKQKLPITPDILRILHAHLDLSLPADIAMWAACLCAFFTFFQKSTLLPKSPNRHDCVTDICRRDVSLSDSGAIITVKHTKTLQFCERTLQVPLPPVDNSILCPVNALKCLFALSTTIPDTAPLFSYPVGRNGYAYLCHASFISRLHQCLKAGGLNPALMSGHSFRRGGASFAFACGVPAEVIQLQGDWRSSAYLRYMSMPLDIRQKMVRVLAMNL